MRRRKTKTSIVVDGLFGGSALKGDEEKKNTVPNGLFDDSDDEKELKKELMKI